MGLLPFEKVSEEVKSMQKAFTRRNCQPEVVSSCGLLEWNCLVESPPIHPSRISLNIGMAPLLPISVRVILTGCLNDMYIHVYTHQKHHPARHHMWDDPLPQIPHFVGQSPATQIQSCAPSTENTVGPWMRHREGAIREISGVPFEGDGQWKCLWHAYLQNGRWRWSLEVVIAPDVHSIQIISHLSVVRSFLRIQQKHRHLLLRWCEQAGYIFLGRG